MILPQRAGHEGPAEDEVSEGLDCRILNKDREESRHRSIPGSSGWRSDQGIPDRSIVSDPDLLKLLQEIGGRDEGTNHRSELATIVLPPTEAGTGPDPGPGDPCPAGEPPGSPGAGDDRVHREGRDAGSPAGAEGRWDPLEGLPRRIGQYLVIELLDGGGQAQVFRVLHPELAKEWVLKLSRRPIASDPEGGAGDKAEARGTVREALLREGRVLVRCDHPNLVRVVDSGIHEGRPFVVMEYVPGLTLHQFALQHRPGPRQAARLVADLAGAVAYLHAQGIVHQDIKPRNVLIDERGRPRLIDFGLARRDHAWSGPPADSPGGTATFMSPEQALGRSDRIGPWTDVFGLGGLLYYLLTLRPLYQGPSSLSIHRQAREARFLPIRQVAPATPRRIERIAHRALAADPERRYRTAAELEAALRRFLAARRIAAILLAIGLVCSALALWRAIPTPPRIVALHIEAFRGETSEAMGRVGMTPRPIREQDDVEVSFGLDAPSYCYLIALNPDGQVQLAHPERADRPSPRSDRIRFPADDLQLFGLTDGPGLQAFVAMASRRPLPPFETWKPGEELARRWRSVAADRVWRYSDRRFTSESPVSRGIPRRRTGAGVPAPFREVCEYLAGLPEAEAIEAIAFPVGPKP
jgi:serine/threonine protein kinase